MRMKEIYKRILCPAKVNLILRVGPRLASGYHPLETLMLPLDWGDEMELHLAPSPSKLNNIHLELHPALKIPPAQNLVLRAMEAFRIAFRFAFEGCIHLKKIVPTGAGLGGGSSDAGTLLRVLAESCGVRDQKKLLRIATRLGADVPLFLNPAPAWCTGFGEKISRVTGFPRLAMVLVHSRKHPVPTGWAYQELDRLRESAMIKKPLLQGRPRELDSVEGEFKVPRLINDFEAVATSLHPRLKRIKSALAKEGALTAAMSGSGSSFFGVFPTLKEAQKAAKRLQTKEGLEATACSSLPG